MIVTVDRVNPDKPLTSLGRLLTIEADSPDAYAQVLQWATKNGYDSLLPELKNCFEQEPPSDGLGVITNREHGLLLLAQWHQSKPPTIIHLD